MITGSHIPPERNGLIFMASDGGYCSDHVAFQIEQRFESFSDKDGIIPINSISDLKNIGKISQVSDVWSSYYSFIEKLVDLDSLKTINAKIIVDPCNGTACHHFTTYLKKLGLTVQAINDEYKAIPNRPSEPKDSNLSSLKSLITSPQELGVAFDVDADRVTFVSHDGTQPITILADHMGALIAKSILSSGHKGKLILPVNSSNSLEVIANQLNSSIIYCKIGQPATIEAVKREPNPAFSYEESGKFYFVNDGLLWTDALLMVLKVLALIAKSHQSLYFVLQEQLGELLNYVSLTHNFMVEESEIKQLKDTLVAQLKAKTFSGEVERLYIDGVRISFNDNSWLLLRPSGTEPKIRVVSNASNKNRAEELLKIGEDVLASILSAQKSGN